MNRQDRDARADGRDLRASSRDADAEARDLRATSRDQEVREETADDDVNFPIRFMSAGDRDDAAGDRADALADRHASERDRQAAGDDSARALADAMSSPLVQQALEHRTVIGQAQGILMERMDIDPDAAFQVLRVQAERTGRQVRDVAADVVADHR